MATEKNVVTLSVNSNKFAIGIEKLVEIIQMVEIRPLPDAPDFIKGVVDYRGEIIPVCDLSVLLGDKAQECSLNTPILILSIDGRLVGFVVEKVVRVMASAEMLAKPISHIRNSYVTKAFEYKGTVYLMIDLEKVFKASDKESIKQAFEVGAK